MKREFDAVKYVRQQQERIYQEIKDMTPDQQIEYFKKKSPNALVGVRAGPERGGTDERTHAIGAQIQEDDSNKDIIINSMRFLSKECRAIIYVFVVQLSV